MAAMMIAARHSSAMCTTRNRAQPLRARSATVRMRMPVPTKRGVRIASRAEDAADDFDAILARAADKFEKSENKVAIVGYIAAAAGTLVFAEWLIHLPVLNFLLGFPIQLLGLVTLPYFAVRYLVDNKSVTKDVGDATGKITKLLPGLDK